MTYTGLERRRNPRAMGHFVVSYRLMDEMSNQDVTQTKNISLGGLLLTTNRKFDPGLKLAVEIKLPFDPNPIMLIGKVIDSRQVMKDLIYDTRLEFLAVDEKHRDIILKTVDYYFKKEKK
jgi:hypothetical protein